MSDDAKILFFILFFVVVGFGIYVFDQPRQMEQLGRMSSDKREEVLNNHPTEPDYDPQAGGRYR